MPTPYSPASGKLRCAASASLGLQELVRHLHQDAGAVAGQRIAAARAAMRQVLQNLQALLHDVVRLDAFDVGDEADAAGVVLEPRIVQSLLPSVCATRSCRTLPHTPLRWTVCLSPLRRGRLRRRRRIVCNAIWVRSVCVDSTTMVSVRSTPSIARICTDEILQRRRVRRFSLSAAACAGR